MYKEIVISILALIVIIIGNVLTQNFIEDSVQEVSTQLAILKEELMQDEDDINLDSAREKVYNLENEWNKKCEKLSYFLEHDELEKVYTELTAARSFVDTKEYEQSVCEIDKALYTLGHIENKTALHLKNIF